VGWGWVQPEIVPGGSVTFNEVVDGLGKTIDGADVAVIVVGALAATVIAGTRARVAKLICTGVLIRTFLSFSLELEISGRWPWQKPDLPAPRTEGR
jgi:hypothetical protein